LTISFKYIENNNKSCQKKKQRKKNQLKSLKA
jgi:hypothetical protein